MDPGDQAADARALRPSDYQPVLLGRHDLHDPARLRLVPHVEGQLVAFKSPGPRRFRWPIGRADAALDESTAGLQLEGVSTAGAGEVVARRSEHHLGIRVLLAGVHPAL